MSDLKTIGAKLLLTGLLAAGLCARAQEDEPRANPVLNPPHQLTYASHDRARAGSLPILYTMVTAPNVRGGTFAFLTPPAPMKPGYDARAGAIRFTAEDQTGWITVRLISIGSGSSAIDAEATGRWLTRQHQNTKLLKSGEAKAGSLTAFSYDLLWPVAANVNQVQRIVFIPTAIGIVEFTLNSTPDGFPKFEAAFREMLFTFKVCPNGKHDLAPPPSDSN